MQGKDGAHKGSQIDDQHHVIALYCKGPCELLHSQVGQQIEHILDQ